MRKSYFHQLGAACFLVGLGFNAMAKGDLKSAFQDGSVTGELRSYHNYRNFKTRDNTSAFAAGINLHAATAPIKGFSIAGSFYVSDDLDTRNDDPDRGNPNLPTDVQILGQAYLQYESTVDLLRIGRQAVNTPFANPSDAFMIPITYEAVSYTRKSGNGLTLNALYLDRIKGRPDDRFVDISEFSANRFQNADAPERGVWAAGANYQVNTTVLQGWGYLIPEQFYLSYVQIDHGFGDQEKPGPRIAFQLIQERDHGNSILGKINTNLVGVRGSVKAGPATLYAAWNHARSDDDAFNRGGLLAPFSYSTSPVFTNSMVQTLENGAPGNAYKIGLESSLGNQVSVALSYASYRRQGAVDTHETDADVTYRFSGQLDGLSLRLRVGVIGGDRKDAKMTEVRSQIQYLF